MTIALARVRLPKKRAEHILRRRRLLDLLHQNVERKLTFISASAGYGKTSLLLDFATDVDATVCWYSVARSHTDLAAVGEHIIAAFQQNFPTFGVSIESAGPAAFTDPTNLAVLITNEMIAQVGDFCIFMIDDFHVVGETDPIVRFIEALINHLPEHVRLAIASRSVYGVPTLLLDAQQEMGLISQKELQFRPLEIQDLIRQISHTKISYEQASELARHVDGWIFAIQLAARAPFESVLGKLDGVTKSIFGYLRSEVLPQQPSELQQFLLATSIVEEFDAELCNHLLKSQAAASCLQEALGRNLFITQLDTSEGTSYQYHQLFTDFLRAELQQVDPAWEAELHRLAADWYARRNKWDTAAKHWLDAGQPDQAAKVMDQAAPGLYVEGRIQILKEWGEWLTASLKTPTPHLALAYAKVLIDQGAGEKTKIGELLDQAEAGVRREDDNEQLANVLITRGWLRYRNSQFAEALSLAEQAEALGAGSQGYRWLQARRLRALSLHHLGQSAVSITLLEPVAVDFRRLGHRHDLAGTLSDLAFLHERLGNLLSMQKYQQEALELQRPAGGARLIQALNNLGVGYHLTGQHSEAWEVFEQASRLAENAPNTYATSLLMESRGNLLRDLEEWTRARAAYQRSLEIAEQLDNGELLSLACSGFMELERRLANFSEAMNWLREATRHQNGTEDSLDYQFGLGQIYFGMGQYKLAAKLLEPVGEAWHKQGHASQNLTLVEFLLACIYLQMPRTRKRGLNHLQESLLQSARLGTDQFLIIAIRQAPHSIQSVDPADLATGQKQWQSILATAGKFVPGLESLYTRAENKPVDHPLRIEVRAFGKEQVWREGELVSSWVSARARALFYFLCQFRSVERSVIALEFWPDFSTSQVTSNLNATLWRVRKAVGEGIIVFHEESYGLAPDINYWSDSVDFELFIGQSKNPSITDDERADLNERAVKLYRGPFLNGINMGWAEDRRRSYALAYLNALIALGDWELGRGRLGEARNWYEIARTEDDIAEAPVYGIVQCLIKGNAAPEARTLYQHYKQRLAQELGEEPSEQFQLLIKRAQ